MWSQRLAALSGAAAVAAGAVGAHALPAHLRKKELAEKDVEVYVKIFETGSRYHLLHAVALLCSPMAKYSALTAGCLAGGQALFAGSLYTVAFNGSRDTPAAKVAPAGGILLILGWLSFAL
eukprot:3738967-Amphidinium_carterae.1